MSPFPLSPARMKQSWLVCPDITLSSGIPEARLKYYIKGEPVAMLAERVEYLDANAILLTASLRDYNRKTILQHYASLDQFIHSWQAAERKAAIIAKLATERLFLDLLLEEIGTLMAGGVDHAAYGSRSGRHARPRPCRRSTWRAGEEAMGICSP